jgi:predicted TIM-barrel fold metal-dependent hydrolase
MAIDYSGITYPIIDTHAHLFVDYDWAALDATAQCPALRQVWLLGLDCYKESTELAGNAPVLEVAKRYPGFFIPFGFIDFTRGPEQIDHMREQGFLGLKAIRPALAYDHEQYFPLYDRAQALDMPILFHVGVISNRTADSFALPKVGFGPTQMRPSMLDAIAAAFPNLKLIQGHMGVPWCNELFESLWYYPNIRCSVSGLVDYQWLQDHLGDVTAKKTPMSKKLMFSLDGAYGRRESLAQVLEAAEFFRMFFLNVGRTKSWHGAGNDFLYTNAAEFIDFKAML